MRAQAHMGERKHNLLPPMESHARTERGQTTDKQQRTTNHIALLSRQVSSLISNDVFNINAPDNGAIRLNKKLCKRFWYRHSNNPKTNIIIPLWPSYYMPQKTTKHNKLNCPQSLQSISNRQIWSSKTSKNYHRYRKKTQSLNHSQRNITTMNWFHYNWCHYSWIKTISRSGHN